MWWPWHSLNYPVSSLCSSLPLVWYYGLPDCLPRRELCLKVGSKDWNNLVGFIYLSPNPVLRRSSSELHSPNCSHHHQLAPVEFRKISRTWQPRRDPINCRFNSFYSEPIATKTIRSTLHFNGLRFKPPDDISNNWFKRHQKRLVRDYLVEWEVDRVVFALFTAKVF